MGGVRGGGGGGGVRVVGMGLKFGAKERHPNRSTITWSILRADSDQHYSCNAYLR